MVVAHIDALNQVCASTDWWEQNDQVMLPGRIGVDLDDSGDTILVLGYKMGDGKTMFTDLPYMHEFKTLKGEYADMEQEIADLKNIISELQHELAALKQNPAIMGGDLTVSSLKIIPRASGYTTQFPILVMAFAADVDSSGNPINPPLYYMTQNGDQVWNIIRQGLDPEEWPNGVSLGMELHNGYWAVHRVGTDGSPYHSSLWCSLNGVWIEGGNWADGATFGVNLPTRFYATTGDGNDFTGIYNPLNVYNDAHIYAPAEITGDATIHGDTSINGNMAIAGNTTADGDATIDGNFNAAQGANQRNGVTTKEATNLSCGSTTERPIGGNAQVGSTYFDTDLGKLIWCKAVDASGNATWVDSTGATV